MQNHRKGDRLGLSNPVKAQREDTRDLIDPDVPGRGRQQHAGVEEDAHGDRRHERQRPVEREHHQPDRRIVDQYGEKRQRDEYGKAAGIAELAGDRYRLGVPCRQLVPQAPGEPQRPSANRPPEVFSPNDECGQPRRDRGQDTDSAGARRQSREPGTVRGDHGGEKRAQHENVEHPVGDRAGDRLAERNRRQTIDRDDPQQLARAQGKHDVAEIADARRPQEIRVVGSPVRGDQRPAPTADRNPQQNARHRGQNDALVHPAQGRPERVPVEPR